MESSLLTRCDSSAIAVVVYAGLVGLTILGFSRVPAGFVPTQDKGYLVSFAQLPNGATPRLAPKM